MTGRVINFDAERLGRHLCQGQLFPPPKRRTGSLSDAPTGPFGSSYAARTRWTPRQSRAAQFSRGKQFHPALLQYCCNDHGMKKCAPLKVIELIGGPGKMEIRYPKKCKKCPFHKGLPCCQLLLPIAVADDCCQLYSGQTKGVPHGNGIESTARQLPLSTTWFIELGVRLRSPSQTVVKSLGTAKRAEAEIIALPQIAEHKARLLAARPRVERIWQSRLEPGLHIGPDGGHVAATERELTYYNHNGAFLRTEANGDSHSRLSAVTLRSQCGRWRMPS